MELPTNAFQLLNEEGIHKELSPTANGDELLGSPSRRKWKNTPWSKPWAFHNQQPS
jgi:hypothetical protein